MMSSNTDPLVCPTCCASFRRAEHLRRHLASHSSSRPFKCHSCSSGFKRRDVLRKHWKGCSLRLDQEASMPEPLPVGKKATSCDRCAQAKKRCDRKVPCSTCAEKHHTCTYERQISSSNRTTFALANRTDSSQYLEDGDDVSDIGANDEFENDLGFHRPFSLPDWSDGDWAQLDLNAQFLMQTPGTTPSHYELHSQQLSQPLSSCQLQPSCSRTSISKSSTFQPSFDYLLNVTQSFGVKATFNYKRGRLSCTTTRPVHSHSSRYNELNSEVTFSGSLDSCHRRKIGSNVRPSQHRVGFVGLIESLEDPLFGQTKAIWDSFRLTRIRSSKIALQSVDDPDRADERCLQFFCPKNLRKYTRIFWDEWYPHCPIIHKPTFNMFDAPVILLVPMIIIGAFMSDSAEDASLAAEWLEFGEEIVFSSAILSSEPVERVAADDIPPLRVLQAAYIICVVLNWEGSDTMKRRVRHHHFATIVSAVREIGISSSNHYPFDFVNMRDFSWHKFIEREEAIRTLTYVFLLDTAFVIFNNTPPRMVIHEMDLEMTTSESCFQADNASDCYRHWCTHLSQPFTLPGSRPLFLAELISILMRDNYDAHAVKFANMSTLNLFVIISGLHTVLFQQLSLFTCLPTSLQPLRAAFSRWQSLWGLRSDNKHIHLQDTGVTPEGKSWQDTGFIGHAQEFAWLLIARLDTVEGQKRAAGNMVGRQTTSVEATARERLDDTSMTVVADLMLSLTVNG